MLKHNQMAIEGGLSSHEIGLLKRRKLPEGSHGTYRNVE